MMRIGSALVLVLLFVSISKSEDSVSESEVSIAQSQNTVFQELMDQGIELGDGAKMELPEPTLADGVAGDAQQKAIAEAAGRYPITLFAKDSRVAPFTLKTGSIKSDSGEQIGRRVDVWFIAHGELASVRDGDLLKELGLLEKGSGADTEKNRDLTAEELAEREIALAEQTPEVEEGYGYFDGPLLNKVRVSGVVHTMLTQSEDSILLATLLDERFADDKAFANRWRSESRDSAGRPVLGDPQLFAGFGGYSKATVIEGDTPRLLVELHIIFSEPEGWFNGKNLLGSKLPILVQDNVRAFRTKLKK